MHTREKAHILTEIVERHLLALRNELKENGFKCYLNLDIEDENGKVILHTLQGVEM